jgi:MFS family permease
MASFALTIGVQGGLTRSAVRWLLAAGSLVQIFALPSYAALSHRSGRRPVVITGCIAATIAIYPIQPLISSGSLLGVLLGFLIAMPLVQAAIYGPLAAFTTRSSQPETGTPEHLWATSCPSPLGGGFAP